MFTGSFALNFQYFGSRKASAVTGSEDCIAQKARYGHWTNAARNRRDGASDRTCRLVINVSDETEFAGALHAGNTVDTYINDAGAGFNPTGLHHLRTANSRDENICAAAD